MNATMTTYNYSPGVPLVIASLAIVGIFAFAWTVRRQIRDGWAAARALADEYNDQYNMDSEKEH
jgi:hypothetical protein